MCRTITGTGQADRHQLADQHAERPTASQGPLNLTGRRL
jgi:hypothetical protein